MVARGSMLPIVRLPSRWIRRFMMAGSIILLMILRGSGPAAADGFGVFMCVHHNPCAGSCRGAALDKVSTTKLRICPGSSHKAEIVCVSHPSQRRKIVSCRTP